MKHAKKLVLAALMVAVMAFALCSCGANVDGTYVVTEAGGNSVDEAIKKYAEAGINYTAEEICTIVLSDGKNFKMTVMGKEQASGTYKASGETLTLTVDDSSMDATIKDDVISITVGGQNMKLKKK